LTNTTASAGPLVPLRPDDLRVLLLPPTRRDGEVTQQALAAAGMLCTVCTSVVALMDALPRGVGAVMATDRLLAGSGLDQLVAALEQQASWSSVPVLLLCRDREQARLVLRGVDRLRNVTLLDRPTSMRSMTSAVQAALRGRRWQYQIRDQLQAQLRAEEALRQADQRKDEFLATLAHELRNPLAPIKSGLQVLKRTATPQADRPDLFDMMDRQLSQLVKLIDELLDVSRIATGKVVLQRELVDMRAVVALALEGSQPVIDAGGHSLQWSPPAHEVRVVGDPSRLAQAIGNLLNNAAKYTPAGGRVVVGLRREAAQAVVTVTDTGMGIPPEMLARVFDMFAQVDRTLDRAQGGLGIGLALVRSLVQLHGGSVRASSEGTDRGSSFELRVPAVSEAQDGARAAGRPGETTAASAQTQSRPLRVMVVDDNVDAADTLGMLLRLSGHATRVEYSAAAALDAAHAFMPEAVFCDLGMPGMSGHDLARRVRRDGALGSALLIAVTGWGGEEDQRRSRAAGFDYHLTKPASVDRIEAILTRR
jgi:signal transduction histidine kinase